MGGVKVLRGGLDTVGVLRAKQYEENQREDLETQTSQHDVVPACRVFVVLREGRGDTAARALQAEGDEVTGYENVCVSFGRDTGGFGTEDHYAGVMG